jgi:hypothetical protein
MMNAMCSVDRIKKRKGTIFDQTLGLLLLRQKVKRALPDSRFNDIDENQIVFCKAANLPESSCFVLHSNKVKNH